jgi:two-component system phosphate regulon sensor histidine kinase PhoR
MVFARHEELDAILREAANTDEPVSKMIDLTHPVARILQTHAIRFPTGSTRRLGTVAVLHDMTEVANVERVRREFVANASHEIRTPLAAIQGFSETLLRSEGLEDSTSRSHVEVIERHAHRLGRLVADLLQLSEAEGRNGKLEPSKVNLAAVIDRAVRDFGAAFDEKSIEVIEEIKEDVTALADPHAVEQVVRNILDNACQYTEAGGRVKLSVEAEVELACIRIEDTGIGIPERDLGRIFERFYRVDKARSRAAGGTGLGLSIVKHLVQSMNGSIDVASVLGCGSTFTLRLPRARS